MKARSDFDAEHSFEKREDQGGASRVSGLGLSWFCFLLSISAVPSAFGEACLEYRNHNDREMWYPTLRKACEAHAEVSNRFTHTHGTNECLKTNHKQHGAPIYWILHKRYPHPDRVYKYYIMTREVGCEGPVSGIDGEKTNGSPEFCVGNPINIGTANKFQAETDYASRASGDVAFNRYYNSQDDTEGPLGIAWRHGYERRLNISSDEIKTVRPDGRIYTFTPKDGGWQSDPDVTDTLEATVGGWTYTTVAGTQEIYDSEGRLLTITDHAGRTQTLTYGANGKLIEVVDAFGRSLQFAYDSEGRLTTLTDPAGITTYTYSEGRLASITYPDGAERHYRYENGDYPNALTTIVDGAGNTLAAWTYDENGWARSSTHAGGADDTKVAYNGDDSVTVTNPLGKQTTYHFKVYHGVPKVVEVEGHATASCEGANRAYAYNDNGSLISKTDWRGTITTYVRDEKGRELSRTEAVGTPEERTVTTEWHPEFNEPVRITEPGQITEFTYDAEGRLLSRTTSTFNQ